MDPIVLTESGETLEPYSGFDELSTTDGTALVSSCWGTRTYSKDVVGIHDVCNGIIRLRKISVTHNALCCNQCGLRIAILIQVDTYRKLRRWCEFSIQYPGLSESAKKEMFLATLVESDPAEEEEFSMTPPEENPPLDGELGNDKIDDNK
jgi:hypothetical protein